MNVRLFTAGASASFAVERGAETVLTCRAWLAPADPTGMRDMSGALDSNRAV